MWCSVLGQEVSDFLTDFSSFTFRVKQFSMTANSENEGTTTVQNIKNYLLIDIVSYPRILESLATPQWKQILVWKIGILNYAHYAVPHPRYWSLQQHYCQNFTSTHGRLSLWLVSVYSLGNPEQYCENPVITANNLHDIPPWCLLNFINRAQKNLSYGTISLSLHGSFTAKSFTNCSVTLI